MRITIGTPSDLVGTTLADRPELAGIVLEDVLEGFADQARGVSGTIQLSVQAPGGTGRPQFTFRIHQVSGGEIDALIWTIPGAFADVDVDYRIDGLGEIGPSSVSLTQSGDLPVRSTLAFRFAVHVTVNVSSRFVFLMTESQTFERAGTIRLEGPTSSGARWAANVSAFAPTAAVHPPAAGIGPVSEPLELEIFAEALCVVRADLIAAAGHNRNLYSPDDAEGIDEADVRIVFVDPKGPKPVVVSQITIPDSRRRAVIGVVSESDWVYLVIQEIVSARGTSAPQPIELITIDLRNSSSPRLAGRVIASHVASTMPTVALSGNRVWVSSQQAVQPFVVFDIGTPGSPRQLPSPGPIRGLQANVSWMAAAGDVVHVTGSTSGENEHPIVKTISAIGDTESPHVLSTVDLPLHTSRVFAGPTVAVVSHYHWAPGSVSVLTRTRGGSFRLAASLEFEGDVVAVAVHPGTSRLIALSRQVPTVEVWQVNGDQGLRLGTVEYPQHRLGSSFPWPQIVLADGKACFCVQERLHTVDVSKLLISLEPPGRSPDRQPPPQRIPRPRR